VNITDVTKGAAIYYTTDGSTPDTGSTLYNASIVVSSSETLKAIAAATGYTLSAAASADYVIVQKLAPDVTAVSSSLNPSMTGNAVTFTVSVTSSLGSPSGTVAFMDGSVQLGSATLSGGSASFTTSALAAGSHPITATYSGDDKFVPATSTPLAQLVESFSIAPLSGSSTTATVSPGGQATYTLTITPPAAGGALTFSVTGLPSGATGTFSPSTVVAGAAATQVTLTIAVPVSAAAQVPPRPFQSGAWPVALGLLLLPFARRLRNAPRRWLSLVLLISAGLLTSIGVSACGGGSSKQVSPPQTYTLTVTAASRTLTQSTTLTLIIQH
jgi:hypothetical protein